MQEFQRRLTKHLGGSFNRGGLFPSRRGIILVNIQCLECLDLSVWSAHKLSWISFSIKAVITTIPLLGFSGRYHESFTFSGTKWLINSTVLTNLSILKPFRHQLSLGISVCDKEMWKLLIFIPWHLFFTFQHLQYGWCQIVGKYEGPTW